MRIALIASNVALWPFRARDSARWIIAVLLAAIPANPQGAASQTQERLLPPTPQVDLGFTSFLDGEGGVPAPPAFAPGALVEVIANFYAAPYARDPNGHVVPDKGGQRVTTSVLHPVYISDLTLAGGHLGFETLLPFSSVHVDTSSLSEVGYGDTTFAPFLQWGGLRVLDMPAAMRFGLQAVAPTGLYSSTYLLNLGQNAWQFSPYLAFTLRVSEQLEISGRLIYSHSSVNTAPPEAFAARSIRSGDLAVVDLSSSYDLGRGVRVGIAGYTLQQLNPSTRDQVPIPSSLVQTRALGPGLQFYDGQTSFFANVYKEFASRNRTEGTSTVIRFLHPF